MEITNLNTLKLNLLSEEQYEGIVSPEEDELYLTAAQGLIYRGGVENQIKDALIKSTLDDADIIAIVDATTKKLYQTTVDKIRVKYSTFDTSTDGLVPKSEANTNKFLKGDGTWADTPVATHASTHKTGGDDELTPSDIGASKKGDSFTITLAAQSWSNNKQTVTDEKFIISGYGYIISPSPDDFDGYTSAIIRAEDVSVTGQITFICEEVPLQSLTVNILRIEVEI